LTTAPSMACSGASSMQVGCTVERYSHCSRLNCQGFRLYAGRWYGGYPVALSISPGSSMMDEFQGNCWSCCDLGLPQVVEGPAILHFSCPCLLFGCCLNLLRSAADELNLRWSSIAQRLILALQLIPIQKAKATSQRLVRSAAGYRSCLDCMHLCCELLGQAVS